MVKQDEPTSPQRPWKPLWLLAAVPLVLALLGAAMGKSASAEVVEAGTLWLDGQVPLWSQATGLGRPVVGDGRSWVFHPAVILHGLAGAHWGWALDAALHVTLAGVCVWLLARCGGWSRSTAPFLAIAGQVVIAILLAMDLGWGHTTAPLPLALVAVVGLVASASAWRVILLALILTLMLLAGRIELAVAGMLVAVLLATISIIRPPACYAQTTAAQRARALPLVLVSITVATLLAGVQWVPVFFQRDGDASAQRTRLAHESAQQIEQLPRLRIVRAAQTVEHPADATQRLASVDPNTVVVLDRRIDPFYAQPTANTSNLLRSGGSARRDPILTVLEDRPGLLRVKVTNPAGWLVVSGAYADGWRGTLQARTRYRGGDERVTTRDAVVMPAYGFLRAMPLTPLAGPDVEAEMRYWPVGWKRGLVVSALGAILVILLFGWTLIQRDTAELRTAPALPQHSGGAAIHEHPAPV